MVNIKNYVYRQWDEFYKVWSKFKWTLRPSMIDWWREYGNQWLYKWHPCPKTPRREYKEDYQIFKEIRGNNEVYLYATNDTHTSEVAILQLAVAYPLYYIKDNLIVDAMTETRGRYSAAIFNLKKIDKYPREEWWIVTPNEKYIDALWERWRDANIYSNLWGWLVDRIETDVDTTLYNMNWAWKPIDNFYNKWYEYKDWHLSLIS